LHAGTGWIHNKLFKNNNSVFEWLGQYKAAVQWALLAIDAVILFTGRLTVSRLVWCVVGLVIAVLLVEVLAAAPRPPKK
jgi:hypothetical protein